MPIKRLVKNGKFPQIGTLRKGEKKTGNKPGKDLEYFRFVPTDQGEMGADVLQLFREFYGSKPQQINILFPYEAASECFTFWQEHWVAGGLKHRCDGETCVLWQDAKGMYSTEAAPCPGGCKEVGYLDVIVPELGRMALVTVLTTSIHDIMELQDNLLAVEALRGDLRGIPFILRRRPRMVSTPSGENGKRARREKWLLCVEAKPDWVALQLEDMRRTALPAHASPDVVEAEEYQVHEPVSVPNMSPFDEPESAPDSELQPPPNKPTKKERPLSSTDLKEMLMLRSEQRNGKGKQPPGDDDLSFTADNLLKACGSAPKRDAVLMFLDDKTLADLNKGECLAIDDWLGATKDNGYTINPHSLIEIEAILSEVGFYEAESEIVDKVEEEEIPF